MVHVYLTYPFVLSWSMLEAMALGACIVGSATPPVEEVIRHRRNGLLVDFFSRRAIAEAVVSVLADPAAVAPLRAAARETALSYDLGRVCLPAHLRLIEAVAAGGGRDAGIRPQGAGCGAGPGRVGTPEGGADMTPFHCEAIPTETADRFRRTGRDDRGNPVRRVVATLEGGFPCRHCLRPARAGETVLLGSYDLPRPLGIYWTPSPIFLHEAACPRATTANALAPIVRVNPLVSVRPTTPTTSACTISGRSVPAPRSMRPSTGHSPIPARPSSTSTPHGRAAC